MQSSFAHSDSSTSIHFHPLLRLMHKPEPKLGPDQQDKRSVVPIEPEHWDQWLNGSPEHALELIRVPALELFAHGAADPAKQVALPLLCSERWGLRNADLRCDRQRLTAYALTKAPSPASPAAAGAPGADASAPPPRR